MKVTGEESESGEEDSSEERLPSSKHTSTTTPSDKSSLTPSQCALSEYSLDCKIALLC